MTARDHTAAVVSVVFFRIGQLILLVGYVLFMVGIATNHWVDRPSIDYAKTKVDPTKTDVVKHFGIFAACKQEENGKGVGECGSMANLIHFVDNGAIKFVQALMIISSILYISGFILELIQLMPLSVLRNFLAENRLVEMFSGIATVLGLTAMVIYAGEVKNKAELVPGQEDEAVGWSFTLAIVGLSFCIVGLVVITMFRHLPIAKGSNSDTHSAKGGSWLRIKNSNSNRSSSNNATNVGGLNY